MPPHLLRCQGLAVDDYSFALGRLEAGTPSTFAQLGYNHDHGDNLAMLVRCRILSFPLTYRCDKMVKGENISSKPDISIVIPVKDEEENVFPLAVETGKVMAAGPWNWECLRIDDGSKDLTLTELERINKQDPHHGFISLDENFGQAGYLHHPQGARRSPHRYSAG